MKFKEVVGRRRSIRYFVPYRPVEREKIQTIMEAARLASCAVNASFLRAVVIERDQLSADDLQALKVPTTTLQLDMAPVHIYFYGNLNAIQESHGDTLRELFDVGALNATHGWSHKFIAETVWPQILDPISRDPNINPIAVSIDCGVAMNQALLAAFDEGLGALLTAFNTERAKQVLKVPDHFLPLYAMLVGYPAESWEAGGQRPRPAFESLYFEGEYGVPMKRDPAVVERLKRDHMIQDPAPLPWRKDEIRALSRMFGLPE